jgi:hypothetical protein
MPRIPTITSPLQREVINATIQGRDALCLLPAGGGKSLTYQVGPEAVGKSSWLDTSVLGWLVGRLQVSSHGYNQPYPSKPSCRRCWARA